MFHALQVDTKVVCLINQDNGRETNIWILEFKRNRSTTYLLEYLGLPYEEKRYLKLEEWEEASILPPFNSHVLSNLPYIKDGDKWIYESQALYIYLAHRAHRPELLGATPEEKVAIAQVRGVVEDLFQGFWGLITTPEEIYATQKDALFTSLVLKFIVKINKLIEGRQWSAGNNLTVIDFLLFEIEETLQVYNPEVFNQQASLKNHHSKFANIPQIKAYLTSDKFISAPFYKSGKRWF